MRAFVLALAVTLSALPSAAQSAPDFSGVDALIQDSLAQIGGGAVVRVVRADTVVYERAYGAFAVDEAVEIASATKWVSGAVLLSLVDSGDLALDDRLADFFPTLTGVKRSITIQQLFALTSGITGNASNTCVNAASRTLDSCVADILAQPLSYAPGEGFWYGGASMHVAARAAEVATGRAWVDLFEERIAGPLGMTQTAYISSTNPWIGGGLVSSAPDYTAFLQMVAAGGVYEGQRVLSQAAIDAMLADQSGVESGVPVLFSPFSRYAGGDPDVPTDRVGYGVGVWREQLGADGALRQASSPGAFGFSPWVDLDRGLGGALVVRDSGPDVFWTYLELKRRIGIALDAVASGSDAPPVSTVARIDALWPNPVAQSAQLTLSLSAPGHVQLAICDVLGRPVAVIADGAFRAGRHALPVDVGDLAGGVYLAVLRLDGRPVTQRPMTVR